MATQADVRRIALSLPETEEAPNHFAFSVRYEGKLKGFVWVWMERVAEPHYNGFPAALVRLAAVTARELRPIITETRRCQAPQGPRSEARAQSAWSSVGGAPRVEIRPARRGDRRELLRRVRLPQDAERRQPAGRAALGRGGVQARSRASGQAPAGPAPGKVVRRREGGFIGCGSESNVRPMWGRSTRSSRSVSKVARGPARRCLARRRPPRRLPRRGGWRRDRRSCRVHAGPGRGWARSRRGRGLDLRGPAAGRRFRFSC